MSQEPAPSPPVLRLVRGRATPEELAAVIALLAARAGAVPVPEQPAEPSRWSGPQLRGAHHPGPGAWRASALPV